MYMYLLYSTHQLVVEVEGSPLIIVLHTLLASLGPYNTVPPLKLGQTIIVHQLVHHWLPPPARFV